MAFCKYCGRKLEDGEVCNCRQQTPAEPPVTPAAEAPAAPAAETTGATSTNTAATTFANVTKAMPSADQVKDMAQHIWTKFLVPLKAPATGSAAYIKDGNLTVSIALMVLHALCSGIFAAALIGKINSVISMGGIYTASLKLSGIGGFFQTVAYSLILAVLLAGLFFGAAKLLHIKMNFQNALAIASMRSLISIPVALISFLLVLINVPLGMVFFYFVGTVAAVCFLMLASNGIQDNNHNRKAYVTMVVIILFILISLIFARLVMRNYLPSSMGDFFSIENIMGGLY